MMPGLMQLSSHPSKNYTNTSLHLRTTVFYSPALCLASLLRWDWPGNFKTVKSLLDARFSCCYFWLAFHFDKTVFKRKEIKSFVSACVLCACVCMGHRSSASRWEREGETAVQAFPISLCVDYVPSPAVHAFSKDFCLALRPIFTLKSVNAMRFNGTICLDTPVTRVGPSTSTRVWSTTSMIVHSLLLSGP